MIEKELSKIEELAQKLYEMVLHYDFKNKNQVAIYHIIKKIMEKYNEDIELIIKQSILKGLGVNIDDELIVEELKNDIINYIYERLADSVTGEYYEQELGALLLPPQVLSDKIHKNSHIVAKKASHVIKEHIKANKGIKELSILLFDGYDPNSKQVLEIRHMLPTYLANFMITRKGKNQVKRLIERLKTKSLKAGYKEFYNAVVKQDYGLFAKALKTAVFEKGRFIAYRIAHTETFRASNLARAVRFLEDEDIELVRYEMSNTHNIKDICDYYANRNFGYGKGIYPKDKMITLPLHPFCKCKYEPYTKKVTKQKVSNPDSYFDSLPIDHQRQILGGYKWLRLYQDGYTPTQIFNAQREVYKIKDISKILPEKFIIELRKARKMVKEAQKATSIEDFKKLYYKKGE